MAVFQFVFWIRPQSGPSVFSAAKGRKVTHHCIVFLRHEIDHVGTMLKGHIQYIFVFPFIPTPFPLRLERLAPVRVYAPSGNWVHFFWVECLIQLS